MRVSTSSGCGEPVADLRSQQVLGVVDVLDSDQADEVLMLLVMVEGQLRQLPQGVDRLEVLDVELLLQRADTAVRPLKDGQVQALLATEVVVDHPLGGAGLGRDLVDPGSGKTLVGEFACGHVDDLCLGSFGIS
jgi:hypothetical protein